MRHYIPEPLLADMEHSAKRRATDGEYLSLPVHVNVLLALIDTYREAREQHLQKSEQN